MIFFPTVTPLRTRRALLLFPFLLSTWPFFKCFLSLPTFPFFLRVSLNWSSPRNRYSGVFFHGIRGEPLFLAYPPRYEALTLLHRLGRSLAPCLVFRTPVFLLLCTRIESGLHPVFPCFFFFIFLYKVCFYARLGFGEVYLFFVLFQVPSSFFPLYVHLFNTLTQAPNRGQPIPPRLLGFPCLLSFALNL